MPVWLLATTIHLVSSTGVVSVINFTCEHYSCHYILHGANQAPGCSGHPPAQDRRSVSFVQYWCEEVVSWCVGALAVGDMVTSAETLN